MLCSYKFPQKRTLAAFCLLWATLLQGCGGVWSARDLPPAMNANLKIPEVAVTPISNRATKAGSDSSSGFSATLPMLLSSPVTSSSSESLETTVATTPLVSVAEPLLPASILIGIGTQPPANFFLPAGLFAKTTGEPLRASISAIPILAKPIAPATPKIITTRAKMPDVFVYASRTTRAYLSAGGVDALVNTQMWEEFLRKYDIPFEVVTTVERLETKLNGVLLLPSVVALSEREKQAVISFREKGGGVLASWLTGVRNEYGEWRGFGFMETALDVKVVGSTESEEDDTFIIPHGDNPVTHQVPAGFRVWMERIKEWYPLRLVGRHSAAQVMDWSRSIAAEKQSSTIVFDERDQLSGSSSRTVVLGFPERLWVSADAKMLEPILLNSLMWLLRQPDAYTSAWPYPYTSAFVWAIDAADTMTDADLRYGKMVGGLGGQATYYVLSEQAEKAADILKKIQTEGHEIAYLGDRFEGFKDMSTGAQSKRFDTMMREMKEAGVELTANAGFHPPMESYDRTTEKLLKARSFGYLVAGLDASEARLPFAETNNVEGTEINPDYTMIVLPRTQSDPEDLMSEGDPVGGMKLFLNELDLAEQMAGLSVVRISNKSSLTDGQFAEIFKQLKKKRPRMWLASAGQVAQWWRQRGRVSISLDSKNVPPLLTVRINGDKPLQQAANVWVNLPVSGSSLRLVAAQYQEKLPKTASIDSWRSAVVLDGLLPGEHSWYLYFDRSVVRNTK